MRLYSEKHAEVLYHPILKAIVVKWKEFATPEDYQKTIEFAYSEIVKRNCSRWISDMTGGKAVSLSSAKWIKEEFIPKMAEDGIVRKIAFLIDYNPFRKLFIDSIRESIAMTGVSFKTFKSQNELESWLNDRPLFLQTEEKNSFTHYF